MSRVQIDKNNSEKSMCIHSIIERRCAEAPKRCAVSDTRTAITYYELNMRANMLANKLIEEGVCEGDVVAILSERTVDAIIGFYAVLKAGAVYLPIDKGLPRERIRFILRDSAAKVLLRKEADYVPLEAGCKAIDIAKDWGCAADFCSRAGAACAYIIYTSGSTGTPKGVLVPHRGVVNLEKFFCNDLKVTPQDIVGQFANLSFDASIWEILMALFTGAQLHIIPDVILADMDAFPGYVSQQNITFLTIPPHYAACLNPNDFPGLNTLITAGAPATLEIMKKWSERINYVNAYGPTETSICAAALILAKGTFCEKQVTIGYPILDYKIDLVDKEGRPVAENQAGEIVIAGECVALGYLNQSGLTEKHFKLGADHQLRFYTGDIGLRTDSGKIKFLGRADTQIKLRGYRIELDEIKKAIQGVASVKNSVVAVKKDLMGQEHLCAYVVPDSSFDLSELKKKLKSFLPGYMLPEHYSLIAHIPYTKSGKINLEQLENPYEADALRPHDAKADIKTRLAFLWRSILGEDVKSPSDNFFEMGGQSLKAINLKYDLIHEFNVTVTISEIYHNPVFCDMLQLILDKRIKGNTEMSIGGEQL